MTAPATNGGGALTRARLIETAIAAAALGALAAVVYGPHAVHGGFVSDAWGLRAAHEFAPDPGLLGTVRLFVDSPGGAVRPLDAIRLAVQSEAFGPHMGFWLAWQGAMAVAMSTSIYLLLRELGIERVHAAAIAALVLIFPAASSIRLWTVMGSPAAITLAAVGFFVGLRAFTREAGAARAFHAVSLTLLCASLLVYEAALPVMLASALVYRLRTTWRAALTRWTVDVGVLGTIAILVKSQGASLRGSQDVEGMWGHAGAIADQALTLLTTVTLPLGGDRWQALALITLIPLSAIVGALRLPRTDPTRGELSTWLLTLAGGLAVVALSYAMFVPADEYYEPMATGLADRTNALPSVGWVLVLYAMAAIAATLAFRGVPGWRPFAAGATLLVCAVVAAGWLQAVKRDTDAYARAYAESEELIRAVRTAVPDPLAQSTIWTFGHPLDVAPNVPVVDQWGSLTSRIRLAYDDPTLTGLAAAPGTRFTCADAGIVPRGPHYDKLAERTAVQSSYRRTYFVDASTGRGERIRTRRQCRRVAGTFPRAFYFPGRT